MAWAGCICIFLSSVFSGPQVRDVEHFSSTLLHVYILIRCGREGTGGAARELYDAVSEFVGRLEAW